MSILLFFDTETTGKADFKKASVDPAQPNLVQLGAILVDGETRRELMTVDVIVKPDDWTIPVEAANVHGIPQELAERVGILHSNAVYTFRDLLFVADTVVAHNIQYDELVMDRACAVTDLAAGEPSFTYPFGSKHRLVCTMREATDIAKVPSRRPMHRQDYKWPSLAECSERFFGKGIEGAHNALVDVRVCKDIYFYLADQGVITERSGRRAKNLYDA